MESGESCPICADGVPDHVIVQLDASWVTAPPAAALPGYLCVVARSHVVEPFELDGLERRRFWEEVLLAAQAAQRHTNAAKVNYEIHGNTMPHLHCHLYPRFAGDPFAGRPIDGTTRLFERRSDEIDALTQAVRREADRPDGRGARNVDPAAVYDEMADWFERHSAEGFYNAHYDRPAVLQLIGDVVGARVLDVGCGAGHYLSELRRRGATVTGVDGSAELLRRARARVGDEVRLVHHDLNRPLAMFADGSFDGVVMALVYHHVDDRQGLLAEVRRVVKSSGWLVLSTSHPLADWLEHGGSYFTVEKVEAVFDVRGGRWRVPFWRMPLTALLGEVLGAGFQLDRLVEPVPPPESRAINARAFRRLTHEPAFLALRLRRL